MRTLLPGMKSYGCSSSIMTMVVALMIANLGARANAVSNTSTEAKTEAVLRVVYRMTDRHQRPVQSSVAIYRVQGKKRAEYRLETRLEPGAGKKKLLQEPLANDIRKDLVRLMWNIRYRSSFKESKRCLPFAVLEVPGEEGKLTICEGDAGPIAKIQPFLSNLDKLGR